MQDIPPTVRGEREAIRRRVLVPMQRNQNIRFTYCIYYGNKLNLI
jgi:hypothetical protein